MTTKPTVDVHLTAAARRRELEMDARVGLTASPKCLPPVWFYDELGSQLFEQITARLKAEGIDVTRRTVAKYREDMKIPSTHQRRIRN